MFETYGLRNKESKRNNVLSYCSKSVMYIFICKSYFLFYCIFAVNYVILFWCKALSLSRNNILKYFDMIF